MVCSPAGEMCNHVFVRFHCEYQRRYCDIEAQQLAVAVSRMLGSAAAAAADDAAGKQRVLMVKDSCAQTTPPHSPSQTHHHSSQLQVTAGSKVNGVGPAEFRTVVNVFDDKLQQASTEMERRTVVMDTDSLQSAAAAAAVNARRVYTDKPTRRTNAVDKLHNSKGLLENFSSQTFACLPPNNCPLFTITNWCYTKVASPEITFANST